MLKARGDRGYVALDTHNRIGAAEYFAIS